MKISSLRYIQRDIVGSRGNSPENSYNINHIKQEIAAKLDKEMEALEGVRLLQQEAERRIEKIIGGVWGEENITQNFPL